MYVIYTSQIAFRKNDHTLLINCTDHKRTKMFLLAAKSVIKKASNMRINLCYDYLSCGLRMKFELALDLSISS